MKLHELFEGWPVRGKSGAHWFNVDTGEALWGVEEARRSEHLEIMAQHYQKFGFDADEAKYMEEWVDPDNLENDFYMAAFNQGWLRLDSGKAVHNWVSMFGLRVNLIKFIQKGGLRYLADQDTQRVYVEAPHGTFSKTYEYPFKAYQVLNDLETQHKVRYSGP